ENGASYEALNVDLRSYQNGGLPCVRLDAGDTGFRTCVAIFPGILLSSLYDEHGSRLLELNVRSYLQAKGKINKGILETLRKDPADFMAYNNGITVVAESILFGDLSDGRLGIHEIKGMQIVNGGQTTASIHRAKKEFGADISNVYIQGKIVTVDPSRFNIVVPLISKFSNTQNKVSEPDLQANHPFHIGIERVSKREWCPDQKSKWFYERARGSYQTARTRDGTTEARKRDFDTKYPSRQRIEKEDLARFENCWRSLPFIANRGRQKSFVYFMTLIKEELGVLSDSWEPSIEDYHRCIAKAIFYRDVQQIVKSNAEITKYAINVTNYTVSMIAQKTARRIDLESIWKSQRISPALTSLTVSWAPTIFKEFVSYADKQAVHPDNTLKSQATWEHLLSLDLKIPESVEGELTSAAVPGVPGAIKSHHQGVKLTAQELNNVNRCMEYNQTQWLAIISWGQGSGQMKTWQMGIATTLASYAAQGWAKLPSPKQAKHGVVMIDAARMAGVIT
ncbi:MAG: AIPR family protein, partial [Ktedonobacteraceae bacterium]